MTSTRDHGYARYKLDGCRCHTALPHRASEGARGREGHNGMTSIGLPIGNPSPGPGLRVRFDCSKSMLSADWSRVCGAPGEYGIGPDAVQQLELRGAERHRRVTCPNAGTRRRSRGAA